jgi:hypothetical protein
MTKIIENVVASLLVIALFSAIGGGLWWGATAAYGWVGDRRAGRDSHLRGR